MITFDVDKNMTQLSLNGIYMRFTYDGKNHLLAADKSTFIYDAEDYRIGTVFHVQ